MIHHAACLPPSLVRNYSHALFRNGFFRNPSEKAKNSQPDVLTFETGYFGLEFDPDDLSRPRFGRFYQDSYSDERDTSSNSNNNPAVIGYKESVLNKDCSSRLVQGLFERSLEIKIVTLHDGKEFVAKTCAVTHDQDPKRFNKHTILWEAGKVAQHFQILGLDFVQKDDNTCSADENASLQWITDRTADLDIVLWPDSFSLTLQLPATLDEKTDTMEVQAKPLASLQVSMSFLDWSVQEEHSATIPSTTSLVCDVVPGVRHELQDQVSVDVVYRSSNHDECKKKPFPSVPVTFSDRFDAYLCTANFGRGPDRLFRSFAGGYTDIHEYDEFVVTIQNKSRASPYYVPFVLYIKTVANVTGLCPIVCDLDGRPLGIPIQLSKNWHDAELPPYAYFYTMLPVAPNHTDDIGVDSNGSGDRTEDNDDDSSGSTSSFLIRVVYGFYGTLPSATHAQLSLEGPLNGNGRWEQLAIGCFGETLCIDPEITATVDVRITDCRGLFLCKGRGANRWGWTECGWGGDFLKAYHGHSKNRDGNSNDQPLRVVGMKTGYFAHGPCLTDVVYSGFFGEDRAVDYQIRVRTIGNNDYPRNLMHFRYSFHGDVTLGTDGYLHMMLNQGFFTPTAVVGFRGTVTMNETVPNGKPDGEVFRHYTHLPGLAPFWLSFPNSTPIPYRNRKCHLPAGTKHMVIRSFRATIGGESHEKPSLTFIHHLNNPGRFLQGERPSLFATIGAPVRDFSDGDVIEMEVEWMTTALTANDYYGDNEYHSDLLQQNPQSHEPVRREALSHCYLLGAAIKKGKAVIVQQFPLTIRLDRDWKNNTGEELTDETDSLVVDFTTTGGGLQQGFPMEFQGLPHTRFAPYSTNASGCERKVDQSHRGNDFWQTEYDAEDDSYTMTFNPIENTTQWQLREERSKGKVQ